jgi:hypothetical protein
MNSDDIYFGMNRSSDEKSLASFLKLFCRKEVTDILVPRMSDQEITDIVDHLTRLMHTHLKKSEYHELFLGTKDPHS